LKNEHAHDSNVLNMFRKLIAMPHSSCMHAEQPCSCVRNRTADHILQKKVSQALSVYTRIKGSLQIQFFGA
jgi:hypothetical protein